MSEFDDLGDRLDDADLAVDGLDADQGDVVINPFCGTVQVEAGVGADGQFTLYEDEFDNYNYEKGAYTEIPMTWDDKARRLTIGARRGSYPGMLASRTFTVRTPDGKEKTVTYKGKKVTVRL